MYIGTVIRSGSIKKGGELIHIDFNNKEIIKRKDIYPQNPSTENIDKNKRGNSRGCRGVFKLNEHIIACDFHTLLFFDSNLKVISRITDNAMVGLHELYFDERSMLLYLTSTTINTVVIINLKSMKIVERIYLNSVEKIVKDLELSKVSNLDFNIDYRTNSITKNLKKERNHMHLNAIAMYNDDLLILLNRKGIVYNLSKEEILFQNDSLIGGHNICVHENYLFSCNTLGHSLFIYSLKDKIVYKEIDILKYGKIRRINKIAQIINFFDSLFFLKRYKVVKTLFCRGLKVDGDYVFMGTSPAMVLKINWKNELLEDLFKISNNPRYCIHGLQ